MGFHYDGLARFSGAELCEVVVVFYLETAIRKNEHQLVALLAELVSDYGKPMSAFRANAAYGHYLPNVLTRQMKVSN